MVALAIKKGTYHSPTILKCLPFPFKRCLGGEYPEIGTDLAIERLADRF